MVPFYGQGMNAGLEDVRVLFSIFDHHALSSTTPNFLSKENRGKALAEYSTFRGVDAHAINDLALENYTEMRASVISPLYKARKWLEEKMSIWAPEMGWRTKYSTISFGNERYSEVVKRSERQGRLLIGAIMGVVGMPILVGGVIAWMAWRRGRRVEGARVRELFGWMSG